MQQFWKSRGNSEKAPPVAGEQAANIDAKPQFPI
jgi:hypothetical protein